MSEDEVKETAMPEDVQTKEEVQEEPISVEEAAAAAAAASSGSAPQEEPAESASAEQPAEEKPAEPTIDEVNAVWNDKYLRLRADFENFRRRQAREYADVKDKAKQNTISEFLSVYDFFTMALEHFNKGENIEDAKMGFQMIVNEFQKAFDNLGVTLINAVGQDFDPNLHEAVSREETTEVPEGRIIRQWKPGFKIGDKLLRAATVVVATAPVADAVADATSETDSAAE